MKKKILITISAILLVAIIAGAYILYSEYNERQKVIEDIYAKANQGIMVNISDEFFTAEDMDVAFKGNLALMASERNKKYSIISLDALPTMTPEKRKIIEEHINNVPLEKGTSNITEDEIEKIKEICGKSCIIVKRNDFTVGVASDYNRKPEKLFNHSKLIQENAHGIIDYLKNDYNIEMRQDVDMINFVSGRHLTPEEVDKVLLETAKDETHHLRLLVLENNIDDVTKTDLENMKELCENACILHMLDEKRISVLNAQ